MLSIQQLKAAAKHKKKKIAAAKQAPPPLEPIVQVPETAPPIPLDEARFRPPTPTPTLMPDSTFATKQAIVEAKSGPTLVAQLPSIGSSAASSGFLDSEPFPLDAESSSDEPPISPLLLVGAAAVLLFIVMR